MSEKPTYEQLELKIEELESEVIESKKLAYSLRESEQKYRFLAEGVSDIIWTLDLNLKTTYVSPSITKVLGFTPEERMHQEASGLMTPESYTKAVDILTQELEREQAGLVDPDSSRVIEIEYYHKNDHTVWTENVVRWLRDHEGNLIGIHGVSRDITERKQAQQELQIHHDMLSAVFENAPYTMLLVNEAEKVIRINRTAEKLTGRTKEQMLNQPCGNVLFCQNSLDGKGCGHNPPCAECPVRTRILHTMQTGEPTLDQEGQMTFLINGEPRIHHLLISTTRLTDVNGKQVLVTLSDITERKRAEEATQQEKIFSDSLINSLPGIFYLFDETRKFLRWNDNFEKVSGYSGKEITSIHPPDLFEGADRELIEQSILEVFSSGKSDAEAYFVSKSGARTPYYFTGLRIQLNALTYLIGVGVDITERKRAEEALRQSEENYHQLFEAESDAIFLIDNETGNILQANRAACKMYGYSSEELLAMKNTDLSAEAEQTRKITKETRPVADHVITIPLRWHRNKDGKRFPVEITGRFFVREGRPVHIAAIRDITERKQAEAERERLMAAIEQAGEVIIITDPEGIIQYVNPAFETVTGYTREDALGQTPRILKSGKQDEAFYQKMWSTLTGGDVFKGRMINKRKNGKLYTEDATISPVYDAAGKIVNYVAVKRDITEHLRLEAQLRQAQKMESVGRLAGGVAHDFNNMLSAIIGNAELALIDLSPENPQHDYLKEILDAARRSADITRQLLAFARRQTIRPEVLDLNETVEGMLKMLRRLIGEDIDLSWQPGFGLWPVKMDPSQIDQILANLLVNARDAISGVGGITIETENIRFDEDYCADHAGFVPGDFVRLAVSDDGCGMDKETLNNLFEPFFTTKGVGEGTGLGLATVYGIVKQNDGFINVYSEPEQGTTFKIYLPHHAGEADRVKPHDVVDIPMGRGETVLIVEDEASILKLAKRILKRLGYAVLEATTPGQAVALAEQHAIDIHLLITDVVMPEMNGKDLADRLQSLYPNLRVLFMSGYTASAIVHRGVLNKGVNFIQKPFSMKDLAAKVREALDKTK